MTVETLGRAFGLYRRTAVSRSMVALLIANAIPLVGVLFFGWSLMTILVLYWIENGIVGFWNVPRIALAQGSIIPTPLPDMPESAALAATGSPSRAASLREAWREAQAAQVAMVAQRGSALRTLPGAGRIGLAMFFVMHYGIFWFVHGIFVFALPTFGASGGGNTACFEGRLPPGLDPSLLPGLESCVASPFGEIVWSSVVIAAVALFISHGASFLYNYVARGEYRSASPTRQMGAAYGRVVVLHLTILLGAFAIALIGAPIGALVALVVLKTALDLGIHLREHGTAATPAAVAATA